MTGGDVETWPLNLAEKRARQVAGELVKAVEDQRKYAEAVVVAVRESQVAYDSALLRSPIENEELKYPVAMHEAWARQEATDELFEKHLAEKMEQHYRKKIDALQQILIVIQSVMKNGRALSGGQR